MAISAAEESLGELRVRASASQAQRLLDGAVSWPQRAWAVEGAVGLGQLLARQLAAAGERVVDVQPRLGARVRLLAAGDTNTNDPSHARSVAIAALGSPGRRQVQPDDHATVLKAWAKRHRDLGRARTQVVCRLTPQVPALWPSHSRTRPHPTTRNPQEVRHVTSKPTEPLTQRGFVRVGDLASARSSHGGTNRLFCVPPYPERGRGIRSPHGL